MATGDRSALVAVAREIARNSFPVAMEVLSPLLLKQIVDEVNRGEYGLMIRFAGAARAVIVETANALRLLRAEKIQCVTHDDDEGLWEKLSRAGTVRDLNLTWRALTRPGELPSFLDDVTELEHDEASHVGMQWQAGIGDGRVRVAARAPVYHAESVRALERMRQRSENLGGNLIIERAPGEIKSEIDSWGGFGSANDLMRRVKQQLDPTNILSPGRFS